MLTSTSVITQTCTGTTPIDTATCPPGFVETTTVCSACVGQPTVTITQPCDTCSQTPVGANGGYASLPAATYPPAVVATVTPALGGVVGTGVPAASYTPFAGAASSISAVLLTVGGGIGSVCVALLLL